MQQCLLSEILGSPIVLIGLPGSGKSSIGKRLAQRLEVPFADSDTVIESKIRCSIREFFEHEGEERFRDIEQATLEDLVAHHRGILATGGGAVLRATNRSLLRAGAHVIYLRSSPEELFRRLRHDVKRPLLQVSDPLVRLRDLHGVRDPLYQETAHDVVETGRPTVPMIVNMIVAQLELAAAAAARERSAGDARHTG